MSSHTQGSQGHRTGYRECKAGGSPEATRLWGEVGAAHAIVQKAETVTCKPPAPYPRRGSAGSRDQASENTQGGLSPSPQHPVGCTERNPGPSQRAQSTHRMEGRKLPASAQTMPHIRGGPAMPRSSAPVLPTHPARSCWGGPAAHTPRLCHYHSPRAVRNRGLLR